MPLILPARTLDSGFEINNSLRFDVSSSPYLSRTPSSSGNRTKFTISVWVKRSEFDSSRWIFGSGSSSSDDDFLFFSSDNQLKFYFDSGSSANLATNRLFRDPSAWYHIVVAVDTTQGTDSNRIKFYVNGTQETSFETANYPSQNFTTEINNSGQVQRIGARAYSVTGYQGGYISDFYLIDGQQLAPTEFGETNDNGVWIPKKYSGSYGTNGTHLEFKNSSNLGEATSGNDFTATNLTATDQTTDSPTNNWCTLNPLVPVQQVPTYSEGNTKVVFKDGGNGCSPCSTFAVNSGKWYFEAKFVETSVVGRGAIGVGIVDADKYNPYGDADDAFDLESFGYSYTTDGHAKTNNSTSSFGSTYASGDIISVAVDFDNRQIYYSKNGTLQNSGDPTSGSSGTGSAHNFSVGTYYFAVYGYQDENSWEMNFGNAPFSISSSNSDGAGFGNFEYAVPSGYYALCTKNLAEYG